MVKPFNLQPVVVTGRITSRDGGRKYLMPDTVPARGTFFTVRGPAGPEGPPGPPGAGVADRYTTGSAVGTHRLVAHDGFGLRPADPLIPAHGGQLIGVSLQSANAAGAEINVQTSGPLTDASFTFTPGAPVFAGPDGVLTQNPAAPVNRAWQTVVGHAIAVNTVFLDLDDTTFLC